jgi:hypothetical protein
MGDDMRAIALAIFIGLTVIGHHLRKEEIDENAKNAGGLVIGISLIAFVVCLIGGW